MTRKTSAYMPKLRMRPERGTFNGAEWLNVIQRSRGYTCEPIPGAFNPDGGQTLTAARGAALRVRSAFDAIKLGQVKPDELEPHDLLAHALGVSWLRAIGIAGDEPGSNPMLPVLKSATEALIRMAERRRRLRVWGFDGPGLIDVAQGLDVYEAILFSSSPAQMAAATERREELLRKRQLSPADKRK